MSLAIAVAVGAALGAPARYLLDRALAGRSRLPLGILVVNLSGCLAIGLLAGAEPGTTTGRLLGLGFLGSFTTASTLAWDVLALGARAGAGLLALHVVGGLALTTAGLAAARAL